MSTPLAVEASSVVLTTRELAVLAFIEGHSIPASLQCAPDESLEGTDPIAILALSVEGACVGLVERGLVRTGEGEATAFISPITRRILDLVCSPSWLAEGAILTASGGATAFRLSGEEDEGVLVTCASPERLTLTYDRFARAAAHAVFRSFAALEPNAAVDEVPPRCSTTLSMQTLASSPDWASRLAYSLRVTHPGRSKKDHDLGWIMAGGTTYILPPDQDLDRLTSLTLAELDGRLQEVAALLVGDLAKRRR